MVRVIVRSGILASLLFASFCCGMQKELAQKKDNSLLSQVIEELHEREKRLYSEQEVVRVAKLMRLDQALCFWETGKVNMRLFRLCSQIIDEWEKKNK